MCTRSGTCISSDPVVVPCWTRGMNSISNTSPPTFLTMINIKYLGLFTSILKTDERRNENTSSNRDFSNDSEDLHTVTLIQCPLR